MTTSRRFGSSEAVIHGELSRGPSRTSARSFATSKMTLESVIVLIICGLLRHPRFQRHLPRYFQTESWTGTRCALQSKQQTIRRSYVDQLVSAGWRAASIEFELLDLMHGCDQVRLLDIYAEGVEMEISSSHPDGAGVASIVADRQSMNCAAGCWENDWTIAGPTLVGCTVGPWTLLPIGGGPIWVGGSQCSMTCWFRATKTCTYTKTKMHENWDCTTCTYTQTGTCTSEVQSSSVAFFPNCVEPVPYVCPPTPDDNGPACPASQCSWTGSAPCD